MENCLLSHTRIEVIGAEEKESSIFRTISFIRFPMIIGIVIIHCYLCGMAFFKDTMPEHSVTSYIQDFLSNCICRACVPLFFVISGFLFFNNITNFNRDIYFNKLKKRSKTLLIPYLLWNLIGIIFLLIEKMPFMNGFFPGLANKPFGLVEFFESFWSYNAYNHTFFDNGTTPIDFPLWFIRNLMILVILTPIIYKLIKWLRAWVIVILASCYILGVWPQIDGFQCSGVMFFTLGAYIGLEKPYALLFRITKFDKNKLLFYLTLCVLDLLLLQYLPSSQYYQIIHSLVTIFGVVIWFSFARLCAEKRYKIPLVLTNTTFFIYAFHGLFSNIIKSMMVSVFHPDNNITWTLTYFIGLFLISGSGFCAYYISKLLSPTLTKILCGGRD